MAAKIVSRILMFICWISNSVWQYFLQVFRGTIKDAPDFDPNADAETLYNAMKGIGERLRSLWLLAWSKVTTFVMVVQSAASFINWDECCWKVMLCAPQVVIKRPYWIWSPQEATHRDRKSLQPTKAPMERYSNTDLVVFGNTSNIMYSHLQHLYVDVSTGPDWWSEVWADGQIWASHCESDENPSLPWCQRNPRCCQSETLIT